jgi:DNA invertase Pin-like site-specific DNA recombinase
MRLLAYLYTHPLLAYQDNAQLLMEVLPESIAIAQLYQDFVGETERPQFQQLLADLKLQPADYLLVRHWGDLGDNPQAVCDREALLRAESVLVVTLEQLQADPSFLVNLHATEISRDVFLFVQSIQRYQQSQRIRAGHAQNRLKAVPPPGKAPYGYRRGKDRYALDRAAAAVVKQFFDAFLMYGSLSGAVRHIGRKCNKQISVATGHRWLTNPAYRGDLVYRNGDRISDTHVPIISRDEAAQVDRLLRRNRLLPKRSASAPHALAGLVKCQVCQSGMVTVKVSAPRRSRVYLYLRPMACPEQPRCQSLPYAAVLDRAIAQICHVLPQAISAAPLPNIEALQQNFYTQLQQKEITLRELEELVARDVLDLQTAELRAYKVRTEIAAIKAKLAQIPPVNLQALAKTVSNPSFWAELSDAECRFYLRELVNWIEITRQPGGWGCQVQLVFAGIKSTNILSP